MLNDTHLPTCTHIGSQSFIVWFSCLYHLLPKRIEITIKTSRIVLNIFAKEITCHRHVHFHFLCSQTFHSSLTDTSRSNKKHSSSVNFNQRHIRILCFKILSENNFIGRYILQFLSRRK